jgi:hypothetical protein
MLSLSVPHRTPPRQSEFGWPLTRTQIGEGEERVKAILPEMSLNAAFSCSPCAGSSVESTSTMRRCFFFLLTRASSDLARAASSAGNEASVPKTSFSSLDSLWTSSLAGVTPWIDRFAPNDSVRTSCVSLELRRFSTRRIIVLVSHLFLDQPPDDAFQAGRPEDERLQEDQIAVKPQQNRRATKNPEKYHGPEG